MRWLLVVSCVLGISMATIRSAAACSCIPPPPPREALAEADAVFFGTVAQTWRTARDINEGYRFATFDVEKVWKGGIDATALVRTAPNGALCGISFEIGQQYVVYAVQKDGVLHTHRCMRTARAQYAQDDLDALNESGEPIEVKPADDGSGCGGPTNAAAMQAMLFVLLGVLWTRRRRVEVRPMNRLALVAMLVLLGGCTLLPPDDDGIMVRTDDTTYRLGATATVRVTNQTSDVARFVFGCTYQIQRRSDAGWEPVYCAACPPNARVGAEVIAPGTTIEAPVPLTLADSVAVDPGARYRLHFTAFFEDGPPLADEDAASNSFHLVP